MNFAKRLRAVFIVVLVLAISIYVAYESDSRVVGETYTAKDTITMWYTDEVLTDYLSSIALAYYEDTDVHVELRCVSGLEYLEKLNQESLSGGVKPDLFIIANTSLEKAYLSGLASEVDNMGGVLSTDHFSQTALNAVTYTDKYVAYPMYFDTSIFVYNKTYMQEMARSEIEKKWDEEGLTQVFLDTLAATGASEKDNAEETAEAADDDGEAAEEEAAANAGDVDAAEGEETEEVSEEERVKELLYNYPIFQNEVAAKATEMVPSTIADILNFADQYDAPGEVEAFFKWDVSDIFSNFFFFGNYVNLGGPAGDDLSKLNLYNSNAIKCMNVYQSLNQFFSIDASTSAYDQVIAEFIEGKTLFTMATTDVIARLEAAKADGSFAYEYGVKTIPSLSENLDTRGFSITNAVVVNGYSDKKAQANNFARYICVNHADSLYTRTGKVPASTDVHYESEALGVILSEYARTVPMPKAIELSNLWIELETAFKNIWTGVDANYSLKRLSEKMKHQITGQTVIEEYIEVEAVELLDPKAIEELKEDVVTEEEYDIYEEIYEEPEDENAEAFG